MNKEPNNIFVILNIAVSIVCILVQHSPVGSVVISAPCVGSSKGPICGDGGVVISPFYVYQLLFLILSFTPLVDQRDSIRISTHHYTANKNGFF